MKSNINKVAERGERLDDLQDKTGKYLLAVFPSGAVVRVWAAQHSIYGFGDGLTT